MTGDIADERRIIEWLKAHPLDDQSALDELTIPSGLLELIPVAPEDRALAGFIDNLSDEDRKLLNFLLRELPAEAIIESMDFESPEEFWIRKRRLEEELANRPMSGVARIFLERRQWADRILEMADALDREADKSRNRKRLRISLLLSPVFLAACYFLFWPLLVKPDPATLFEKYREKVQVDTTQIDTTNYNGSRWYDAMVVFYSDDPLASQSLLLDLVDEGTEYLTQARWFLGLTYLRQGNLKDYRSQLSILKEEDPEFYHSIH
jgi:hypothetical protein